MTPSKKPLIDPDGAALEFNNIHTFFSVNLDEDGRLRASVRVGDAAADRSIRRKHLRKFAIALLALAEGDLQ